LKTRYTVYEPLWRGLLPEAQFLTRKALPDFHAAYQRSYMERDVRLLANVSDWQTFGGFLRLLAAVTAQEINCNELRREIGLTAQTAKRWTALLQATFQWFEVTAYRGCAVKRVNGKKRVRRGYRPGVRSAGYLLARSA
jgi:predicted AAA+ superfamily ATPase